MPLTSGSSQLSVSNVQLAAASPKGSVVSWQYLNGFQHSFRWTATGALVAIIIFALAAVLVITVGASAFRAQYINASQWQAHTPHLTPNTALATNAANSQPCVLQSGEQNGRYAAFPLITATPAGNIFATWRDSEGHQTGGGNIVLAKLADKKADCAWEKPHSLISETDPNYTVNPGGITAVEGALLVAAVRYRVLTSTSARDFRSYILRSTDNGTNWTTLQPVDAGFTGQSYPSSLVTLPDGSAVMALYGTDDPNSYTNWYVRLARSTDGGVTWSPWGDPVRNQEPNTWLEPQLLVDNGQLLMALRYDAPSGATEPSGAFLAESINSGQNWTTPRRITTGTSGMPTLGKIHNGTYTLAYRDNRQPGGPFRYATSQDLLSWNEGNDVTNESARRMLYAGFAVLDQQRSIVVYALENAASDPNGWAAVYSATIPVS